MTEEKADRLNRVVVTWKREKDGLYEHRHRILAVIECPRCGSDVECWADTEGWTFRRGKWCHETYGPGEGECCGLLLVDMWDGARAFELPKAPA